jgi:hypothetical protein
MAVVASLIYLAVQVRQNTAALRTASRQEIVSGFREHNRLLFLPGVDHALAAGLRRYPDLPPPEKWPFGNLINDHGVFFQGVFALHESGALEDETYETYLQYFSAWVITPGGAAWWAEISPLYTPRMVAAVNARIARGDLPDLLAFDSFSEAPAG